MKDCRYLYIVKMRMKWVLLILAKYTFLIYGSDIYEKRRHIHVTYSRRGFKRSCKFWLEPSLKPDENKKGDFNSKELLEN